MGDGPSSESKSGLPPWYEQYAKRSLAMADKHAQTGYVPYAGPDVAAFNPQQVQGMQQANDWAAAFGGAGAKSPNVAQSLPKAQNFAGGIRGLSSIQGYTDALKALQQRAPGQAKYIRSFFIDPKTGKPPIMAGKVDKEVKHDMATERGFNSWLDYMNWLDHLPGRGDGGGND